MSNAPIIEFDQSYRALDTSTRGDVRSAVSGKKVAGKSGPPIITFGTTSNYTLMYKDKGSLAIMDGSFYRPLAPTGSYILGDYAQGNYNDPSMPSLTITVSNDNLANPVLMPPTAYVQVWNDKRSGADMDGSIWMPVAPPGYVALGAVSQSGYTMPDVSQLRCMRFDLVKAGTIGPLIWNNKGFDPSMDVEVYSIDMLTTFYAQGNFNPPTGPVWVPIALG